MKRRRMNGNDSKKIRRTGRAGRIGLCIMLCVLLSALQGMTVPAAAPYRELKGANGRGIYVLLPEDYDDSKEYPSVYFMPKNGYSAQQYIYDDIAGRIRELENAGTIMDMVCVFPELDDSGTPQEQIEAVIGTVQDEYAVSEDASQRGVIGTGTGGYLAFYLGFGLGDGKPDEEPAYFSAIASHDGDFTSKSNPYVEPCGDIYGALDDPVSLQPSVSAQWLRNYYIYIDSNSDSALAFADGGSNDIAQLFRADSLTDHGSASAWDYSVFEYSTRTSAHYGTYLDNLERSLNRFSLAFGMEPEQETEAETEPGIRETVSKGEGRLIDLSGEWHFITQKAMEEDPAAAGAAPANEISAVMEADWESWERVVPGLDWWSADFAECLEGNPYYAGYAWYVRAFDVPDDFEMEDLQVRLGMIDEADEAYLNGGSLRYTPNMAGLNFKLEPTFNRGYFDLQYGLHRQIEDGQDVIFFNYRLNGRNMWESTNSWTKHKPLFVADSGNADGAAYVARTGTMVGSDRGIKQYRQQGGLYGGTWELWESFVAYESTEQIEKGEVPSHTKWSSYLSFMGGYDIGGWFGTDRTIMMTGYAAISGLSTTIAPIAYSESQKDMLLWSFYGHFEPSVAVTPTFHMVGVLGLETFRAENAYTAKEVSPNISKTSSLINSFTSLYYEKAPINYLETAIGIGFDWDFADRAGLHVRYKWMTHSDEAISVNDWHSHYISAEAKAWF